MEQVQPICVIYLPNDYSNSLPIRPLELMNELNGWKPDSPKDGITAPEFKVFYNKDWDKIEFEELKKSVMDLLKNGNTVE